MSYDYSSFCEFMKKNDELDDYDRDGAIALYKEYLSNLSIPTFTKFLKEYAKSKAPKVLKYQLFTFTTKPEKRLPADKIKQLAYILSIVKRKDNLQINDLAYTIEHENDNLHYHIALSSVRSIPADAFKQFATNFGFINKSKKETSKSGSIDDYISKENIPIYLIKDGNIL